MIDFLSFLKKNSAAITVIFTAMVSFSTVIYAILTAILVSETKKLREAQTEPKIYISLDSFDFAIHLVRLKIKNIGLGPASNLTFQPSVISGGTSAEKLLQDFTGSNFFAVGLRHFGPSQRIYSTWTDTSQDIESKSNCVLSFKLKYKSVTGKKYSEEIIIDMSELIGQEDLGTPPMHSIAQSLDKMEKDIKSVCSTLKKIMTVDLELFLLQLTNANYV